MRGNANCYFQKKKSPSKSVPSQSITQGVVGGTKNGGEKLARGFKED